VKRRAAKSQESAWHVLRAGRGEFGGACTFPRPIRYWWRLSSQHLTIRTDRCGRRPVSAGPVRHSGSMALDAVERDTVCSVTSRTKLTHLTEYLFGHGRSCHRTHPLKELALTKSTRSAQHTGLCTPAAIEGEWLELVPVTLALLRWGLCGFSTACAASRDSGEWLPPIAR
jgi:hypothetical protein